MYGAIIGDMVGSPFEFDRGTKTKKFELFSSRSHFTDDSVMTIAIGDALMKVGRHATVEEIHEYVIQSMKEWGQKYPRAGYGAGFSQWLRKENAEPYNSYGNGSAMRVSVAGWLYRTLERTREVARATAEVTHNHPEGIKGAEATASAIYLARTGSTKEEIREYVVREFHYNLDRTCDEIRPDYYHVESCQQTVPEAIIAFLEGEDFEDVLRTAVSLGGDCDTLTAIAASIAEAYYGIPEEIRLQAIKRVPGEFIPVLNHFGDIANRLTVADEIKTDNELIEAAIQDFYKRQDDTAFAEVLNAIDVTMKREGDFIVPVETPESMLELLDVEHVKEGDTVSIPNEMRLKLRRIQCREEEWLAVFTNQEEVDKGDSTSTINHPIDNFLKCVLESQDIVGVIINPWDKAFYFEKEIIRLFFEVSKEADMKKGIYLELGDITKLEVDCIVNAANKTLLGGGGVDGAIHRAAGPELLKECKKLHGCKTGEAKITGGYNLPAKYVIHTVGPIYSGQPMDERHLHSCYYNSLELAKKNNIHSIAFPAISTGVYGYPLEEAVVVAMKAISSWLSANEDYTMAIILCCFDSDTYEAYDNFIQYIRSGEYNSEGEDTYGEND